MDKNRNRSKFFNCMASHDSQPMKKKLLKLMKIHGYQKPCKADFRPQNVGKKETKILSFCNAKY